MKQAIFIFLFMTSTAIQAQTMRYFEFKTDCGHGNWQDTSFIASTNDQTLIDSVLANLARPENERKFISGPIDYGDGGHNYNATHAFLWHFIPNAWELADFAVEVCDGCPFTDVDADTSYWVGNLGSFCPWSGIPVREVSDPLGIEEQSVANLITVAPNPAKDKFYIHWEGNDAVELQLYNAQGQKLLSSRQTNKHEAIDVAHLQSGIYFLHLEWNTKLVLKKLIVQ
jgi:hypothetical protein